MWPKVRFAGALTAAGLLGAAGFLGVAPAGAQGTAREAAPVEMCPDGHGVSVVLLPGSLGGEPRGHCDTDGGGLTAAKLFERAGWKLDRVTSQPAFVCRVDGLPAEAGCAAVPPADAYWSLWSAEDAADPAAEWTFASLGVDGLTVPDGGAVAFSWVDGSDDGDPDAVLGDGTPGEPAASESPESQGAADGTDASEPADPESTEQGLPGWVPPVAVAVLAGVAAIVAVARRRSR